MGGECSTSGGEMNVYKLLLGKPEEKRQTRSRSNILYNIKMDTRDTRWFGMEWPDLFQDRNR
jgi:hypothetical protein